MKYLTIKILLSLAIASFLSACEGEKMESLLKPLVKAPGSTIERDVKGHEQIYSIQVILRLAQKSSDGRSYISYGLSDYITPPIPTQQQIDIKKDELGRMTITSERKHFDVIKSRRFSYALELKYYDLNGKLINHQFSGFDKNDRENSTLLHHQHFFTLQNYALYGQHLVYPMTLDSLYYDEYTFVGDGAGGRVRGSIVNPNNVYIPVGNSTANSVRYNLGLAQRAVEKSSTKEALDTYTDAVTAVQYQMYKTFIPTQMDSKVTDIFTYEYRDTDPVEEELFKRIKGQDDLGRLRLDKPVQLLQQERDLLTQAKRDYLGFKGILKFQRSNIAFQMRICIAHMITSGEKYISPNNTKGLHEHNQISPSWNNYDIDYPIAFRVIADREAGDAEFVKAVQRFYPNADGEKLLRMFGNDPEWFRHITQISF